MSVFSSLQWQTMLPFASIIIVVLTVLCVMIAIALRRSHWLTGTISVIGLNAALLMLIGQILGWWFTLTPSLTSSPLIYESMYQVDPYAQFNMVVILVAALACCTLAYPYFRTFKDHKEELYLLMLLSTVGAMLMVCSKNFASFFMSLELLSVPLYGMLAYTYMRNRSLESGLKYLVLSATASATLLMGMAFIYAATGTLDFKLIGQSIVSSIEFIYQNMSTGGGSIADESLVSLPLVIVGAAMMIFGIAFKLSAAPFHTWTPDVYQGAPAPVATFLASVSKVAMMGLAVRFLVDSMLISLPTIQMLLVVIATLSILVGNLLAVRQTNLKRLLGYSSIAHMGYVLVVIISSAGVSTYITTNMYMAIYALSSVGAFGVITLMSSTFKQHGEASELTHYQGLFWRRPVLTGVMTVMMLSLAGIPLTAGFVTKFFAIFEAVKGVEWFLAAMIIVGSAIGLYYYLRVMLTMFKRPKLELEYDATWHWGIQSSGFMIIMVVLAVLYFGIFPNSLIEWATLAVMW